MRDESSAERHEVRPWPSVRGQSHTREVRVGCEEGVSGDAAYVRGHEEGEVVLDDLPVGFVCPPANVAQPGSDLLLFVEPLVLAYEDSRPLGAGAALGAVVFLIRRVGFVGQTLVQLLGLSCGGAPVETEHLAHLARVHARRADRAVDLYARLLNKVGEDEGDARTIAVVGQQLLDRGHRETCLAHPSEHLAVEIHVGYEAPRHVQKAISGDRTHTQRSAITHQRH
jgi:hypothetical protein